MELKKKSRMEKQRMLQTDRHMQGFREGVGEAGNVFRDRSFSPAFSFRRHFQRLWKSRERLKDVIWRDPMPKGDIPATDKQLWNLKHIFPVFTYSVEKRILLLMLKYALHTIHILLSLMLFLDEFLVALLYLIHAVHHCWKMFASWAGSLSGVALDGLRTELEWRFLLAYWQQWERKAQGVRASQEAQLFLRPSRSTGVGTFFHSSIVTGDCWYSFVSYNITSACSSCAISCSVQGYSTINLIL